MFGKEKDLKVRMRNGAKRADYEVQLGRRTVLLVKGGVVIGSYVMQWCNC